MQKLNRLLTWPLVFLVLMVSTALAAPDVPDPAADAVGWVKALYEAVTSKSWGIVSGLALVGLVYPLRRFGPSIFKTAFGGMVLAFAVSLAGTMGIALAAGAKISLALVASSLATAATAAGVWEWLKAHLPGVQAAADRADK